MAGEEVAALSLAVGFRPARKLHWAQDTQFVPQILVAFFRTEEEEAEGFFSAALLPFSFAIS